MGPYSINSWNSLQEVINNIQDTEEEVIINFNGDFGSPNPDTPYSSFEIMIPYTVKKFTINGDIETIPAPVYNAYIKRQDITGNTAYQLELTLNNLSLTSTANNSVIDIAQEQMPSTEPKAGLDYNRLILAGENNIIREIHDYNHTKTCCIHIGEGTGLYIVCNALSTNNIVSDVKIPDESENIGTSAEIGGEAGIENAGENAGYIDIKCDGTLTITEISASNQFASYEGAGIGGGSSYRGQGGDGGTIKLYGTGEINIHCSGTYSGACIGGGSSYFGGDNNKAGDGGEIDIYGDLTLDLKTESTLCSGACIGGGSVYWGSGGDGGKVYIYDNVSMILNSTGLINSGAGIGGGAADNITKNFCTGGTIYIYRNANITINATKNAIGIGDFNKPSKSDRVKVYGNASLTINYEDGKGIGNAYNIEIYTSNKVSITSTAKDPDYAIQCTNKASITENSPIDIIGGVKGKLVIIHDKELLLNKLDYDAEAYDDDNLTSGFDFDNGYVIVKDINHSQNPLSRDDYFRFNYKLNNNDYKGPVDLNIEKKLLVNFPHSFDNSENVNMSNISSNTANTTSTDETELSDDGILRIYMSDGSYYFTPSFDTSYRTVAVESPNLTAGTVQELVFNKSESTVTGKITIDGHDNHDKKGIKVELYDNNLQLSGLAALTNENGYYYFNNANIGNYYVYISNIPNDYKVKENDSFNINGLSKTLYYIDGINSVELDTGIIEFNSGIIGASGPKGKPGAKGQTGPKGQAGANGRDFPSSSIALSNFDRQIISPSNDVDFGYVVQGNGNSIIYSTLDKSVIFYDMGTYMVYYKANSYFVDPHTEKDYLSLELKLSNEFLQNSFSYSLQDETLHGMMLITITSTRTRKNLKLINVGTKDMAIDNFHFIILKIS